MRGESAARAFCGIQPIPFAQDNTLDTLFFNEVLPKVEVESDAKSRKDRKILESSVDELRSWANDEETISLAWAARPSLAVMSNPFFRMP